MNLAFEKCQAIPNVVTSHPKIEGGFSIYSGWVLTVKEDLVKEFINFMRIWRGKTKVLLVFILGWYEAWRNRSVFGRYVTGELDKIGDGGSFLVSGLSSGLLQQFSKFAVDGSWFSLNPYSGIAVVFVVQWCHCYFFVSASLAELVLCV